LNPVHVPAPSSCCLSHSFFFPVIVWMTKLPSPICFFLDFFLRRLRSPVPRDCFSLRFSIALFLLFFCFSCRAPAAFLMVPLEQRWRSSRTVSYLFPIVSLFPTFIPLAPGPLWQCCRSCDEPTHARLPTACLSAPFCGFFFRYEGPASFIFFFYYCFVT